MKPCLVIPHYNHVREFRGFLPGLLSLQLPILLLDDGSEEHNLQQLRELVADQPLVTLIELPHNRGKGAAVMAGFTLAMAQGFSHALQIDADGQHNLNDVSRFLEAGQARPGHIICGKPTFDDSAPKARVYGRKVTDFWTVLETLSLQIEDGLCGFRLYPLDQVASILDHHFVGPRMDFDTEILVKAVWQGVPLQYLKTAVTYGEGGTSHFNYLRDNLLLIRLHTRLMLGMLARLPWLVAARLRR